MSAVLDLVGIRPGEGRVVVPALAVGFLSVGALGLSAIAADTLFVSAFSLGELSQFYVVSSIVRVVVAFTYAALARRFEGSRFDALLFALAGLVMIGSGLVGDHGRAVIYGVCVLQLLLPPLLPLAAFNRVMSCFHARQAKRLLPLVAAAATVGSIAVGAGAGPIAVAFGTPVLLRTGGLLALSAIPLPGLLAVHETDAPQRSVRGSLGLDATVRETLADLRSVPVVRVVVTNAFLTAAATNLVDFTFKAALKERYSRDEMAAFIGTFGVVANGVVLVAQLFLTSRFVGRFGVRSALSVFPASLLGIGPLVAAVPGLVSGTLAKFSEIAFRFSLGASVSDLLLTPTPPLVRTRAKVFVKGIAGPCGYLAAGLVLSLFGSVGPSALAKGGLLLGIGLVATIALSDARRAYTSALALALGEGRMSVDVSPASAVVLRGELVRLVEKSSAEQDVRTALRTLAVMGDRFFSLNDITAALASPSSEIRHAAVDSALRLAREGQGELLLGLVPPDEDDAVETNLLKGARKLGAIIPRDRLERALARTAAPGASMSLWAESLVCLAAIEKDAAVKQLRKALASADTETARRAAALRALGDLGEKRAEREVLRALAEDDPVVFAEAARTAVLIDAPGAVATLIRELVSGIHVRACTRALALAGPLAINDLIAALPTTRGEGAALATAVATAREVTGTVRAARVLARLGPEACSRVLSRFADLGYRARNAVARAFAASPVGSKLTNAAALDEAMELTLSYAETLVEVREHAGRGLFRHEVHHRIGETTARMLDLAAVIGDRHLIARARAGLMRRGRDRGHALELLENVLPKPLAARTVAVLESNDRERSEMDTEPGKLDVAFDGWLEKCRKFDCGELPSTDPMLGVLEKVLVLRDCSLFTGLSGEELYPVAEIAESALFSMGETVVRQGDPGDALYVVASGSFQIVKGETKLRDLGPGGVFGELALLDGAPRAATVKAASDGQLLRIPRAEFEALLDESPELARGVIRTLVGHLRGTT